jgi:serine protease Do
LSVRLPLAVALALAAFVAAVILVGPAPGPAPATKPAAEGEEVRAAAGGTIAPAFNPVAGRGHTVNAFRAAAAPSPARTRGAVIKDVLPSNVRVIVKVNGKQVRSASGVILAAEEGGRGPVAHVLTNAHVVEVGEGEEARYEILVDRNRETSRYEGRVVARGEVPDADLAVLEVAGLRARPVTLAGDAELELGDEVLAIGAPFGRGLSVSSGIVSQLEWTNEEDEGPLGFKTDAPIGYGASGGGIFRVPDGKLLALVEGYRTAKVSFPIEKSSYSFDVPMPGETFAAPVAKIRRFLRTNGLGHLVDPPAADRGEATADATSRGR